MENFRVRYGRITRGKRKGNRRSTLVTSQKGDNIFFGISKCNLKCDRWSRERGVEEAQKQLDRMLSGQLKSFKEIDGVSVHHSGLSGRCPVEKAKSLISYFEDVTDFLPEKNTGPKEVAV